MLQSLYIQNYALIEKLSIDFSKGLSVITGETGAGKSILLGALKLVLGERADHSHLKDQSRKCIVEASFNVDSYDLEVFFEENELDYWENSIFRREISPQGKGRSFINDTPVKLELLRKLSEHLLDIHAQHQSLQINQVGFQLSVIDALASSQELYNEYQRTYATWLKQKEAFGKLQDEIEKSKSDQDYWQFQFDELAALNYQKGEERQLVEEQETLANVEELIEVQNQINQLLDGEESNLIIQLKQLQNLVSKNATLVSAYKEVKERLSSAVIELEDIAHDLIALGDGLEFDPNRLQVVDERLAEIHRLQKKHLLEEADQLEEQYEALDDKLNQIDNSDAELDKLKQQVEQLYADLMQKGEKLSKKRQSVISLLKTEIQSSLEKLGIPNAQLDVQHQRKPQAEANGLDSFSFLFSANKGMAPQKLANTASGGEVSRLVLAVKSLLASKKGLPTLLFDEIDTGISGEVADQMGDLLYQMAYNRQLICITHLPQIAAKGDQHFFVYKDQEADKTITKIKLLEEEERVGEIAKMLSGKKTTEAAMNNARDLLATRR